MTLRRVGFLGNLGEVHDIGKQQRDFPARAAELKRRPGFDQLFDQPARHEARESFRYRAHGRDRAAEFVDFADHRMHRGSGGGSNRLNSVGFLGQRPQRSRQQRADEIHDRNHGCDKCRASRQTAFRARTGYWRRTRRPEPQWPREDRPAPNEGWSERPRHRAGQPGRQRTVRKFRSLRQARIALSTPAISVSRRRGIVPETSRPIISDIRG